MPRYTQLSLEERNRISALLQLGKSLRQIAFALGRNTSTISRELKRNIYPSQHSYKVIDAERMASIRRKSRHYPCKVEYQNENPGYIGGAVRFKLFSSEVWTLAVWKDRESLNKFLDARRHSDAMYMENQAMSEFKHFNREIEPSQIPYNWDFADKVLSEIPYTKHQPF